MGKTTKATLVFLVLFGAIVLYLTMTIPQIECAVCVTFQGEKTCRTAAAGTREASIESAVTSACGTMASGMTESIRCQHTTPDSVDCHER